MALTTTVAGRTIQYSHTVGRQAASGNGFTYPIGLALGPNQTAYVVCRANENNNTPHTTKLTIPDPGGEEILAEFGWRGDGDGQTTWPTDVAVDSRENVYVSDEWLNRISIFDDQGNFKTKFGAPGSGDGELNRPSGMAFDSQDNLYIVDTENHRVQKFTSDGRFLGKFGSFGDAPGELNRPWGITVDLDDNIYVADWKNHRVQKFTSNGAHLASFGNGHGDGAGELNHPTDVAVDDDGDVYVTDWGNDRVQIYDSAGVFLTSLVGDAQRLSKWAQMAVDANPDYVKARRRVKSLEPEWRFHFPTAIAYDRPTQRIVVADTQRGRLQIYVKEEGYADPQANL